MGQYGSKFLSDLVERHPERKTKVKGQIHRFIILRNLGGHIALSFVDDEGEKSISWRKCVSQSKSTWLANLKEVCRQEITDQVQKFKEDNYFDDMECPSCGVVIATRKQAHVDHKTIPFRDIFLSFVKEYESAIPKEFKSAGNHLSYIFKDQDWLIAELWRDHHKRMADYQILCPDCNIQKK